VASVRAGEFGSAAQRDRQPRAEHPGQNSPLLVDNEVSDQQTSFFTCVISLALLQWWNLVPREFALIVCLPSSGRWLPAVESLLIIISSLAASATLSRTSTPFSARSSCRLALRSSRRRSLCSLVRRRRLLVTSLICLGNRCPAEWWFLFGCLLHHTVSLLKLFCQSALVTLVTALLNTSYCASRSA
jgi:hypothetical protein